MQLIYIIVQLLFAKRMPFIIATGKDFCAERSNVEHFFSIHVKQMNVNLVGMLPEKYLSASNFYSPIMFSFL